MRPLVTTFAVVLLLLLALWWWSADLDESVSPAPATDATASESVLLEVPVPRVGTTPTQGGRTAILPDEVEAKSAAYDLLVVRADTGEPVAFPAVRWRSYEDLTAAENLVLDTDGLDFIETFLASASELCGDGGGRLVLPEIGEYTLIAGGTVGLWGQTEVRSWDPRPWLLELEADHSIRVRVRDTAGTPVGGVPVILCEPDTKVERMFASPFTALTDEETGVAELLHVLRYGPEFLADQGVVLAAVPIDPLPRVAFDPALPTDVPLELVLPLTGRLEVSVVGPSGRSPAGEAFVQAVPSSPNLTEQEGYRSRPYLPGSATRRVRNGTAVFRHVGLGAELTVFARDAQGYTALREHVPGPVDENDVAHIEVQLEARHILVRGRLLDEEGRPLSTRSFAMSRWYVDEEGRHRHQGLHEIRTDDHGCFQLPLWRARGTNAVTFLPQGPGRDPARGARLELHAPFVIGMNDLGDITTYPPPLLVAGHVADEEGRPVAGAAIRLSEREEEPVADGDIRWRGLWPTRGTSGEDGSFALHGWNAGPQLSLVAEHDGHLDSERVLFDRSASDLEIVLRHAGRIRGSILLPDEASEIDINFHLRPRGAAPDDPETRAPLDWPLGATFHLGPIAPGHYTVSGRLSDGGTLLFEVPDVEVRAGEETRDPRLRAIDLRRLGRKITITVLDPQGRKVPLPYAYVRPCDDDKPTRFGVRGENGRVNFFLATEEADVRVSAAGHRPRELTAVSSDLEAKLERGIPVRLEVRQPELLEPGYQLAARLWQGFRFLPEPRPFELSGDILFYVEEPGDHRLDIYVRDRNTGELRELWIPHPEFPRKLAVRDSVAEQVFRLEIPPEAVRRAVEELKGGG